MKRRLRLRLISSNSRLIFISNKNRKWVKKLPYQIYNKLWNINPFDDDPFPSIPHGDSVDGQQKLDIFTGYVFRKSDQGYVGHITKKDFDRLSKDKSVRLLIKMAIKYNKEHHPERTIGTSLKEIDSARRRSFIFGTSSIIITQNKPEYQSDS